MRLFFFMLGYITIATVTYNQVHSYQINLLKQMFKTIVIAYTCKMHEAIAIATYIYMHTMYVWLYCTNKSKRPKTVKRIKLQINLTLAGYMLYLEIENVQ